MLMSNLQQSIQGKYSKYQKEVGGENPPIFQAATYLQK